MKKANNFALICGYIKYIKNERFSAFVFLYDVLYFFFAGYVFSGFLMLALLLGVYAMAYFGIKSLRRNYEIAILKEKIKQNKEKRDKEREQEDENEEEK